MVALIACAVAAAALPATASNPADQVSRWRPIIADAAARAHIPEVWISRVIRAESGGYTMLGGRQITSHAGAMGLMQLMPETWVAMRAQLGLGADPFDPHDNILAGAFFLRQMYDRFGYPGLFGAYNAGPGRYAAHLKGAALPAETAAYMRRTAGEAGTIPAPNSPPSPILFVVIRQPASDAQALAPTVHRGQADQPHLLFAVRHVPTEAREAGTPPISEGGGAAE